MEATSWAVLRLTTDRKYDFPVLGLNAGQKTTFMLHQLCTHTKHTSIKSFMFCVC